MIRWIFLSTCLLIVSCRKTDDLPPTVQINSPNNLSSYSYLDAIIVNARVEDESDLEYIDLELLNSSLQLLQSKRFQVDGKSYELQAGFNLEDIHYETGQYYIRVSGFDGTNKSSEYLEFSYQGVARALIDVLYVEQSGGQFNVKSLNDGSVVATAGVDFLDIHVNSYDQVLYTVGRQFSDLIAFDLDETGELWRRNSMSVSGNDWFLGSNYFSDGREVYYGDADGYKYLVSKGGQTLTVANPNTSFLPEEAGLVNGQLMVDEKNVSNQLHQLFTYNETSGALVQSAALSFDPMAIHEKNTSQAYIFGDDGAQVRMAVYNTNSNSFWEPYNFASTNLKEVIAIDSDRFVLLTDDGISIYTFSSNSNIPLNTSVFEKGKYCATSNSLYLLNNSELVEMSLQGAIMQSYSVNSAVDLDLQYNK